jgi:hypothetical protein
MPRKVVAYEYEKLTPVLTELGDRMRGAQTLEEATAAVKHFALRLIEIELKPEEFGEIWNEHLDAMSDDQLMALLKKHGIDLA